MQPTRLLAYRLVCASTCACTTQVSTRGSFIVSCSYRSLLALTLNCAVPCSPVLPPIHRIPWPLPIYTTCRFAVSVVNLPVRIEIPVDYPEQAQCKAVNGPDRGG